MKTLDLFVVELEKQLNDTMTTESGLELYVDTRFNEFEHRVTEGHHWSLPSNTIQELNLEILCTFITLSCLMRVKH